MTCQWCGDPLSGRQRQWCSENCRKRACDDRMRAPCPECGEPMSVRSAYRHKGRSQMSCRACCRKREAAAQRARVEDVAEMYREGLSMREIAAELGYGPNSKPWEVTEARRLGLIGYRNRGYGS